LAGDVFLSSDLRDEDNLDPGDSGFQTFLHETGHALGLKHPFEGEFQLPSAQDNYAYSLMSYTSSRNYIPDFTYEPSTGSASYTAGMPEKSSAYHTQYSLFDIQTLQHIYGLNLSTKTGDDTYTLTFDDYAYMSIWDAEGIDTLDFSSTTFPSYIDLSGGTLSSIDVHDIDYQMQATIDQLHEQGANGLDDWVADIYSRDGAGFYTGENNLAIVAGTCMENLKTGSADDTVSDNLVDNYIETGAGDDRIMLYKGGFDIIDAGSGFDTVELNDPQTEVQIHSMDDGSILLLGTYFAASLFNVEQVVYLEGETVDFA
jgi:serralysin